MTWILDTTKIGGDATTSVEGVWFSGFLSISGTPPSSCWFDVVLACRGCPRTTAVGAHDEVAPLLQPLPRTRASRWDCSISDATCFPSSIAAWGVGRCGYGCLVEDSDNVGRIRPSTSTRTTTATAPAVLGTNIRSKSRALLPASGHRCERKHGASCGCLQHGAVSNSGDVGEGDQPRVCISCLLFCLLPAQDFWLSASFSKRKVSTACSRLFQNMYNSSSSLPGT